MRKFYLFMLALITSVGAMAQDVVTDVYQLDYDRNYTLWTADRGGWVVKGNEFTTSNSAGWGVTNTYGDKAAQFKLEVAGVDTYYLYNVGAQKYVKKDRALVNTSNEADAVTITRNDDGTFFFTFGDGYNMNIGGSNEPCIDSHSTPDPGNKIIITDVTECLTVVYHYILNYEERGTSSSYAFPGNEYPALDLPYCVTATKPEGPIDKGDANVEGIVNEPIVCTQGELPFEIFADAGSIETWYNLQMHAYPGYTQYLKENDANIAWADADLNETDWEKFKWGFVGDAFGVKLIAKNGKAVKSDGTNNDAAAQLVDEAQGVEYVLTASQTGGPWFCLKNNTRWLNGQDNVVKQWTANDEGSSIKVSVAKETYADYVNYVNDLFNPYKTAQKFDILEGSTVMGPQEFAANPKEINDAIDAANEIPDNDVQGMRDFIAGDNGAMIKRYLDNVKEHGDLANVQFTMGAEYGTLILPCPSSRVDGLTMYTCSEVLGDNTLNLVEAAGDFTYNTPYIVSAVDPDSKFTIIGWDMGSRATHKIGLLTGVLTKGGAPVPPESYILAKKDDRLGFYQVAEGANYKCAQYKCYLTVDVDNAPVKAFYFEGSGIETAIENVMGAQENGAIYDLQGRRVEKAVKGIYIVNGKKVVF